MERTRALRWLETAAALAAAAVSAAMVRDTFASPFSSASPFVFWIPDEWRSAYPWACMSAVAFLLLSRRRGREEPPVGPALVGAATFLLARVAAPPLYALASRLLPESIRDDVLIPCVWAGLALETWLPLFVLAALGFEGLRVVVHGMGAGWPERGARRRHGRGAGRG